MLGCEIVEKSKIAFRARAQGDGTPIVVRVWESRTPGKGG